MGAGYDFETELGPGPAFEIFNSQVISISIEAVSKSSPANFQVLESKSKPDKGHVNITKLEKGPNFKPTKVRP